LEAIHFANCGAAIYYVGVGLHAKLSEGHGSGHWAPHDQFGHGGRRLEPPVVVDVNTAALL